MKTRKNKELWLIFGAAAVYFALFLAVPAAASSGCFVLTSGFLFVFVINVPKAMAIYCSPFFIYTHPTYFQ